MPKAKAPTNDELNLLRRALREKLGIDTTALQAKKKKKKQEEPTDPDEELREKGKVERKGYASSVTNA